MTKKMKRRRRRKKRPRTIKQRMPLKRRSKRRTRIPTKSLGDVMCAIPFPSGSLNTLKHFSSM